MDLDLLLYGQFCITDKNLIVPHPRMKQRAFVLVPLLQLDPFAVIPGQGKAQLFKSKLTSQTIREIMEHEYSAPNQAEIDLRDIK